MFAKSYLTLSILLGPYNVYLEYNVLIKFAIYSHTNDTLTSKFNLLEYVTFTLSIKCDQADTMISPFEERGIWL